MHIILILIFITLFPNQVEANLRDGLVGWWRLDESSGTTTEDYSGTGNTGTLVNSPTWVVGCPKKICLGFVRGSSQHVNTGAVFSLTSSFTASSWVKRTGDIANGTFMMYFSNGFDGSDGWATYIDNNAGTYEYRFLKGGVTVINSAIANSKDVWAHVVWVVSATSIPSLYINGTLVYSGVNASAIGVPTGTRFIGSDQNPLNTPSSFFEGLIDDVRVYNRILTDQEIRDLYIPGVVLRNGVARNGRVNY